MPLYSLFCDECETGSEHFMGMDDNSLLVKCPSCAASLTRSLNRNYAAERIMIKGDTCSGSCDFSNYFDDGLDTYITSRSHRKRVMDERGLTEYEPTSEGKAARAESKYIRAHAPLGDTEALHAARQKSRDMDAARKKRLITEKLEKAQKVIRTTGD